MEANSSYRDFESCRANTLSIVRHGFWYPEYVLTDGQFYYGKLKGTGALKRDMIAETADGTWLIKQASLFGREAQVINMASTEITAKITREKWNNKVRLEMADGFTAVLKKKGIFSWTYYWTDDQLLDFVAIKGLFKWAVPFSVTVDNELLKRGLNVPLIILAGVQTILLKQSQAAAH